MFICSRIPAHTSDARELTAQKSMPHLCGLLLLLPSHVTHVLRACFITRPKPLAHCLVVPISFALSSAYGRMFGWRNGSGYGWCLRLFCFVLCTRFKIDHSLVFQYETDAQPMLLYSFFEWSGYICISVHHKKCSKNSLRLWEKKNFVV